ncbi:NAD(+)/NADH kinase [Nanoarchaeota archaeon]
MKKITLNNVIVIHMKSSSSEHNKTLRHVHSVLKKYGITHRVKERTGINGNTFKGKDFVIVVGGDGTFLRAAHFIKDQVVLGVNSDVHAKEGFLTQANRFDFEMKLVKIMHNDFKLQKLTRLAAWIDGKKLPDLALNEFYIGHRNAYDMSRYHVIIDGKKAFHRSSGLLAGTAVGSYAWLVSAGGKRMPLNSKKMQYIAREVYEGTLFKREMLKGFLGQDKKLEVISASNKNIVVADSLSKEYTLRKGHKVVVKVSRHPLLTAGFK